MYEKLKISIIKNEKNYYKIVKYLLNNRKNKIWEITLINFFITVIKAIETALGKLFTLVKFAQPEEQISYIGKTNKIEGKKKSKQSKKLCTERCYYY